MLCLDTMVRHVMRCDSIKREKKKILIGKLDVFFLDVPLGVKFLVGTIYLGRGRVTHDRNGSTP